MTYKVAERFKSLQGEGLYTFTPMAFIRFVGCSVGKSVCQMCDTDFDKPLSWRGGGTYTAVELMGWASPHTHICLTGGEPLDQDLGPLFECAAGKVLHIETSGTKPYPELNPVDYPPGHRPDKIWVTCSPKPGWIEDVVMQADEIKVIVPGLGTITPALIQAKQVPSHQILDYRWPTLDDARRWLHAGKLVYLQPANKKLEVDQMSLRYVQDLIAAEPGFRLSIQMHKLLHVQ